jgi:hypothetical protein
LFPDWKSTVSFLFFTNFHRRLATIRHWSSMKAPASPSGKSFFPLPSYVSSASTSLNQVS